MTNIIPTSEYPNMVTVENGQPMTNSLKIAEHFGRAHKTVLRKIRDMRCTAKFRQHNFVPTVILRSNPSGGKPLESPAFEITKDGFFFLAFGFSGEKADAIKEGYINAFNWMESQMIGGMKDTCRRLAVVERALATLNANASEGGRQMALKRWHVKPLQLECDRLWQKAQPMLPHI